MTASDQRRVALVSTPAVTAAASHLYDAECALHTAHQTHIDAWIDAASGKLHDAIAEYLGAIAPHTSE